MLRKKQLTTGLMSTAMYSVLTKMQMKAKARHQKTQHYKHKKESTMLYQQALLQG